MAEEYSYVRDDRDEVYRPIRVIFGFHEYFGVAELERHVVEKPLSDSIVISSETHLILD